jgi:hypothetical protein
MAAHETFDHQHEAKGSSDRMFGLVFTAFFAIVGLLPLRKGLPIRLWAIALSAVFAVAALALPSLLKPLNKAWTRLALLLQKITNPIVMGILFYIVLTPMALLSRLMGKDPMRRHFNPNADTYWITRDTGKITPESMRNQF